MYTYLFLVCHTCGKERSLLTKKFTLKIASNMAGKKCKLLDTFDVIYNIESLEKKLGKITDILVYEVTYKEVCDFPK